MRQRLDGKKIDISSRMDALRAECAADSRILAAYFYGSYGTAHQTPLSDVDFAVLLEPGVDLSLEHELLLIDRLASAAGEDDLNVLILNRAPLHLQFAVLRDNRPVFVRDATRVAEFAERVYTLHGDHAIWRAKFQAELRAALHDQYVGAP